MSRDMLFPEMDDHGKIEPHELARRNDPVTSHSAAHALVATGQLGEMCRAALERLKHAPGSTASELDVRGIGSIIAKRLNDLRKLELAHTDGIRRCRVTGKMAQLWWPS